MSAKVNKSVAPVVKWVGGKRQILKIINKYLPDTLNTGNCTYYEPFLGGGAVLFYLQPAKAVINDTNSELVNIYQTIKNCPEELIEDLKKHRNEKDYFYRTRVLDRDKCFYESLSAVERASRILFLNKTCFNGLFRVNNSGEFNTPFGRYKKPNIVNEIKIRAVSGYLNDNSIRILNGDFEMSLEGIKSGDFVYFDPPYDPVSASANFTGYTKSGFGRAEQIRLKEVCDRLHSSGVKFLLSNSATDFIKDLYHQFEITEILANRAVNSNAEKRGAVKEVLVRNY